MFQLLTRQNVEGEPYCKYLNTEKKLDLLALTEHVLTTLRVAEETLKKPWGWLKPYFSERSQQRYPEVPFPSITVIQLWYGEKVPPLQPYSVAVRLL